MKNFNMGFNYHRNKGTYRAEKITSETARSGYHDDIQENPELIQMCLNCKKKKCSGSDYMFEKCKKENGIGI